MVEDIRRGACPECGGSRFATVRAAYQKSWSDDHADISGEDTWRILECRGCETVFLQKVSTFSEDLDVEVDPRTGETEWVVPEKIVHWPSVIQRSQPSWTVQLSFEDEDLGYLLDDLYSALEADLRVLAAIGVRTVFDRATELLCIDASLTFAAKLDKLVETGRIGSDERDLLDVLTDTGSAAAHRGWRPNPRQLSDMMDILESFLNRAFSLPAKSKRLRDNVPTRHTKKAAS